MSFDMRLFTAFLALAFPFASVASSGIVVNPKAFVLHENSRKGALIRVQLYQPTSFDELAEELGIALDQLLEFNGAMASEVLREGHWISLPAELEPLLHFSLSLDVSSVLHVDPRRSALHSQAAVAIQQPYADQENENQRENNLLLSMRPGMAGLSWPAIDQPSQAASGMVFSTRWAWPAQGLLTSGYGWRHGRMHAGIDIANRVGTPILAAADGYVHFAGWHHGGYGYLVELTHSDGSRSLYAHNSTILVERNQYVRQGDILALMGCTGTCTGPHLHFEIHPDGRGATDPLLMLPS